MEVKPEDVFVLPMDSKGRVTIPAEKRKELGIEKGESEVEFAVFGVRED